MKHLLIFSLLSLLTLGTIHAKNYIWIEGEDYLNTDISSQNSWLRGENPNKLSGGDAFAGLPKSSSLPKTIIYKVSVPQSGLWHFYWRCGWKGHNPKTRVRFVELSAAGEPVSRPGPNEGWVDLGNKLTDYTDQQEIGQHRTIGWQRFDPVQLDEGDYIMELQGYEKTGGGNDDAWMMYDVFVLALEPFTPAGKSKPGEAPSGGGSSGGGGLY